MTVAQIRLRAILAGALVASVAACADRPSLTEPDIANLPAARLDVLPAPGTVIIPGLDGGMFGNMMTAASVNESGRATSEFWDNISFDNSGGARCNIGFFAVGTITPGCLFESAGSTANKGGYNQWWGDAGSAATPANPDNASSFMVNGSYQYALSLEGAYTGGTASEIGWFTKSIAGYQFNPIPAFGAKTINAVATVPSDGNWGFYIKSPYNPSGGGCFSDMFDCSDAVGGYTTTPYQQFSLMTNTGQTRYLVGIEDNQLLLHQNTMDGRDSDYNDYIISFGVARGCSPGYWKNHSNWPIANVQFSSIFENAFPGKTLLQVLENNGGGLNALGRHTVSAYLNVLAFGADNTGFTTDDIVGAFNGVFPGGNYGALNTRFEGYTDIDGRFCDRGR